jgi:uncharacterized protein (DUF2235 family)
MMATLARQLIICCDGTNNNLTGRRNDTNVAQLCELLAPDQQNQLLYYDPGVGNAGELPEASILDRVKQHYRRISSLAFGSGVYENIAEAYRFLMRHWQPGDEIYLYGFSRGAFTARSLGGLVTQFGILRPEMEVMVPTLVHLYFLDRDKYQDSYAQMRSQITQLFVREEAREAWVWFVGVWDTVESVGAPVPLLKRTISATPTIVGKRYHHVRHALALDEFRDKFKPRQYFIQADYDYAAHQQSIVQQWFDGCHCDVGGGGINEQAGLSQQTLHWMVQESVVQGLRLNPSLMDANHKPPQPNMAQVASMLASRAQPAHSLDHPRKTIHSEIYHSPWWALAGMSVRDLAQAPHSIDKNSIPAQRPVESSTVANNAMQFKKDSAWCQRRSWFAVIGAMFFGTLLCISMGAFLSPATPVHGSSWADQLGAVTSSTWDVLKMNYLFAKWQLAWLLSPQSPTTGLNGFAHPARAIMLDFAFMATYGYLLGRASGWAFAQLARLRRANMRKPVWVNRLGKAPKIVILGDIAENVFTLIFIHTTPSNYIPSWEYVAAGLISLAALVKWLSLLASISLITWGGLARYRN